MTAPRSFTPIGREMPPSPINVWMRENIFPGRLPSGSLSQLAPVLEKQSYCLADFERPAAALRLYAQRVEPALPTQPRARAPTRSGPARSDGFCRMWEFYLLACEAGFRHTVYKFPASATKRFDVLPMPRDYMLREERRLRPGRAGAPARARWLVSRLRFSASKTESCGDVHRTRIWRYLGADLSLPFRYGLGHDARTPRRLRDANKAGALRHDALPFRSAPHNLEAEQALLGAMLINNEAHDRLAGFLEPQHFYDPLHQQIYETAAKLITAGKEATPNNPQTFCTAPSPSTARSRSLSISGGSLPRGLRGPQPPEILSNCERAVDGLGACEERL